MLFTCPAQNRKERRQQCRSRLSSSSSNLCVTVEKGLRCPAYGMFSKKNFAVELDYEP